MPASSSPTAASPGASPRTVTRMPLLDRRSLGADGAVAGGSVGRRVVGRGFLDGERDVGIRGIWWQYVDQGGQEPGGLDVGAGRLQDPVLPPPLFAELLERVELPQAGARLLEARPHVRVLLLRRAELGALAHRRPAEGGAPSAATQAS